MVELRLQHWRTPRQDTRAVQTLAGAVRYTELQPTGSETSDTDRQSEIVAAINGPICCGLEAKKLNHFSRACACVCVLGLRPAARCPGTPVFVLSNIRVAPMVELRLQHWRTPRQDTRAVQTLAGAVRYTELQPTGSETSDTDRQSEIVAAINGPICCGLEAKKLNHFSRACACVCVLGLRRGPLVTSDRVFGGPRSG